MFKIKTSIIALGSERIHMKKIKVMSVFGTRPEAIKMAPLIIELGKHEEVENKVLITAQHREMLDQVLHIFDISPDYDLDLMQHGQTIVDITSRVLYGVTEIIQKDRPDIVLVHGDTTTTFAAALAAFYEKVPVGHIEAGLRTGNIYSPFPEEMNRQFTSRISSYHYAPTQSNKENLLRENIQEENILITGNTVIDALQYVIGLDYEFEDEKLKAIDFDKDRIITLTCHRRENWGEPMKNIFETVKRIAQEHEDVKIVFPVHKNPNIRTLAHDILDGVENIIIVEPLEYQPFSKLMNLSYLILTDSGGIQEEAPGLGKPVVVLRTETERPEAVEAGTVKLGGVDQGELYTTITELLNNQEAYMQMAKANNPYGDGKASQRIVADMIKNLGGR